METLFHLRENHKISPNNDIWLKSSLKVLSKQNNAAMAANHTKMTARVPWI